MNLDYTKLLSEIKKNRSGMVFDSIRLSRATRIINGLSDLNKIGPTIWLKQVSYILATIYHETASTFLPIEEYGKGQGKIYGQYFDIDRSKYSGLNHLYYGRGFVQITWLANYVRAKKELGIDFVNQPELALDFNNAIKITNFGMVEGWFTGKSLDTYINRNKVDYFNARRIINGTDKALQISLYAENFENALSI